MKLSVVIPCYNEVATIEQLLGTSSLGGISFSPDGERILVLLTNRVHPCAASIAMQTVRSGFHALA